MTAKEFCESLENLITISYSKSPENDRWAACFITLSTLMASLEKGKHNELGLCIIDWGIENMLPTEIKDKIENHNKKDIN